MFYSKEELIQSREKVASNLTVIFDSIKPCHWVINLKNGQTKSSKLYDSFLNIPSYEREEIQALRVYLSDSVFNISKNNKKTNTIAKGFFYHIKEGRKIIIPAIPEWGNFDIRFFAERFGFCYNSKGDALCVHIDHSAAVRNIKKLLEVIPTRDLLNLEKLSAVIKTFNYIPKVEFLKENLITNRVNIALFGKLELFEELGSLPQITANNEEVHFKIDRT